MPTYGKGEGNDEYRSLSEAEETERREVQEALDCLKRYAEDRNSKEREWTESYAMYMSWLNRSKNPYTANLFIPKTHEGVEKVAAFLLGPNQSITARPEEGMLSWAKAKVAEKWLDFIWRKRLNARLKLQTWVKQGIIFGNGILKVGYDPKKEVPTVTNTAIEDIYYDFFEPDIQKSRWVFHLIRRSEKEVREDKKYDAKSEDGSFVREHVVQTQQAPMSDDVGVLFATYDRSPAPQDMDKCLLIEAWSTEDGHFETFAQTSEGWRRLRRKGNPYRWRTSEGKGDSFIPFVKLRFKVSPLPNRAYDMGAVYPTINIQKAFNDLFNQYLSNVSLTNNAMWIRRKGASINARDLIRRPGGIITVKDINKDLKPAETPAIRPEVLEMLRRLDEEFQQASMVAALANSINETATEAMMSQENFYTMLRPLQDNISDALSELGAMILQVTLDNAEGMQTLELFESDNELGILQFEPEGISADYDIRIVPDRNAYTSRLYRLKQMNDFISVVRGDPYIVQRYPNLPERLYRLWLEEAGIPGADRLFNPMDMMLNQPVPPGPTGRSAPSQITNPETMMRAVSSPSLVAGELSKI